MTDNKRERESGRETPIYTSYLKARQYVFITLSVQTRCHQMSATACLSQPTHTHTHMQGKNTQAFWHFDMVYLLHLVLSENNLTAEPDC